MSHAPLLFNRELATWLGRFNMARSPAEKFRSILKARPAMLRPVIALLRGLTDPVVGLNMGQTAEVLAHRFEISREAMDEYAARSHLRLAAARAEGRLDEIEVIYDTGGSYYDHDTGVRPDSSAEKLAKLLGSFDWHHHAEEDELFLVVKGELLLRLRDRDVHLREGEFFIVPRGVEHQPVAEAEAWVLLFEPASTLNTGNLRNERTVEALARI